MHAALINNALGLFEWNGDSIEELPREKLVAFCLSCEVILKPFITTLSPLFLLIQNVACDDPGHYNSYFDFLL